MAASLANERNLLAWQRTAMSWGAAGAIVTRYFVTKDLLRPQSAVGMSMLMVAALIWFDGTRRYHANAVAIRSDHALRVPQRTIRAVWIATLGVILAATVSELLE